MPADRFELTFHREPPPSGDYNVSDQRVMNDHEWTRPENWNRFGLYRSARDARLWVPKKNPRLGRTLNFAHRGAWWAALAPALVPLGFIVLFALYRLSR